VICRAKERRGKTDKRIVTRGVSRGLNNEKRGKKREKQKRECYYLSAKLHEIIRGR